MFNKPEKERLLPGTWYYVKVGVGEVYAMYKRVDLEMGHNCYEFVSHLKPTYIKVPLGEENRISLKHHRLGKITVCPRCGVARPWKNSDDGKQMMFGTILPTLLCEDCEMLSRPERPGSQGRPPIRLLGESENPNSKRRK